MGVYAHTYLCVTMFIRGVYLAYVFGPFYSVRLLVFRACSVSV